MPPAYAAAAALLLGALAVSQARCPGGSTATLDALLTTKVVVTDQAMGARCAVAADFDGDGLLDLVSASSNDNAVSWYRNEGIVGGDLSFSVKNKITWNSLGSRIVTAGDVDGDGDSDVVGASYYDNTVRWFENDGAGSFTPHVISTAVNEGQGVTLADLDNDGDLDVATASSGDHTIAVFINVASGQFCEIKRVVDANAIGARTVVAADFDGDGFADLASASKDDSTVAWYPNDGTARFPTKIIVSTGKESAGAYSLVAADVDGDGDQDLVVASNGNDHVSLWRNDGKGNFTKTLIYGKADFVLSVTAVDFDRDGDVDVASASFFDGYVRWYENLDAVGTAWANHTVYVGAQGHYVSTGDMDNDGDPDLIAVTHSENSVQVFRAATACDSNSTAGATSAGCCRKGTAWDGLACVPCARGTFGVGAGLAARCEVCPTSCTIEGQSSLPLTCSGIFECEDQMSSIAACSCPRNSVKAAETDECQTCPAGQQRLSAAERTLATLGNYTAWEELQGRCEVADPLHDNRAAIIATASVLGSIVLVLMLFGSWRMVRKYRKTLARAREAQARHQQRISTAITKGRDQRCEYPLVFIPFSTFKECGELPRHERARDEGHLRFIDHLEQLKDEWATVFVSHQWLGNGEPDPGGVHFQAVCAGVKQFCADLSIDEESVMIWIDYTSVPQSNPRLQALAIDSLSTYAVACKYFLIIAPTTSHSNTGATCNSESYLRRGWCRLEQWSKLTSRNGLKSMFMSMTKVEGGEQLLFKLQEMPAWTLASMKVFHGDFTYNADKKKLVDTVLALWASAVQERDDIYHEVMKNKADVFPEEFFGDLVECMEAQILTRRPSQGGLAMEQSVQKLWKRSCPPSPVAERKRKLSIDASAMQAMGIGGQLAALSGDPTPKKNPKAIAVIPDAGAEDQV